MKKVLLIAPGGLPVPAVSGGAVQNLVEHLIAQCELHQDIQLFVITPLDQQAKEQALEKYPKTQFCWVQIPKSMEWLDQLVYHCIKFFFHKTKAISFKNNFKLLFYGYRTALYLQKNSFDKVVIENNIRNFLALKLFGNWKKYAGKYYYHLHNIPRTSFGCKKIIQNSKAILCVSQYIGDCICDAHNPIGPMSPQRVLVFKNCIDTAKFCPDRLADHLHLDWRKKLGILPQQKIILFAGRLSAEKGILETIQAFRKLTVPNVRLLVVGSDFYGLKTTSSFEEKLREEAKPIAEQICFTGYIPYDYMPQIYQLADVAVLPSIWNEPAGLTIVEAMASGLPVITTNAGGIPEYTNPQSSIILDRDETLVDQLAVWIQKVLQEENLNTSLRKNAVKTAAEYNTERYYTDFLRCLQLDKESYEKA